MREEKQLLLDEVQGHLELSPAFIMVKYQQMDPNLLYELRCLVRETEGFFFVVKKRIFIKAATAAGLTIDPPSLNGHIGIVYTGGDSAATAKAVYKFKKENTSKLDVLGGHFEGKFCSIQDLELISELPSQNEMRAQLLGTLEAPMSQVVAVMEALLTSVMHCLEHKVQKEEKS